MSVNRSAEILAMLMLLSASVNLFARCGDIIVDWLDNRISSRGQMLARLWLPATCFMLYVGTAITLLFS